MRSYQKTHPWITFEIDLRSAHPDIWLHLGEIQSKCEHIAGVPLRPSSARKLHSMYLAKGIMATTAIEGNTLSEDEVIARISGDLKLPPSKEYLGVEVDNILEATDSITHKVMNEEESSLSKDDLCEYNRMVLSSMELDEHTVPGDVRKHSVTVGRYLGAPAEDCDYLLDQLCNWLSGDTFKAREGYEIVYGVLKAIIAHLYIAWIHPFGDGNGRTARLAEVRILLEAGAPSAAAHLLSNHYNQTRSEYYRQLDSASRSGGDVLPFIQYAIRGLCEQLREQIEVIRKEQHDVTWRNFVHETFKNKNSPSDTRRRKLVLALSQKDKPILIQDVRRLTPEIAELYATKTSKTVNRDLNELRSLNLVRHIGRSVRAKTEIISAFLPERKR